MSPAYGILHATTDKAGMVTDVYLWRQGFQEEREVLVGAWDGLGWVCSVKWMRVRVLIHIRGVLVR